MLINLGSGSIKTEVKNTPWISMSVDIRNELLEYVKHYKTEVSGCGLIEAIEHRTKNDDKDKPDIVQIEYKIVEVFLPSKQDNSGATTDIEPEEIHKLMHELITQGKDPMQLRLHWHSHADMSVFHSGTDEDNYETLNNNDWLVSLVINHSEEMLGRVDYYKPIECSISGLPIYMDIPLDEGVNEKVKANILALDEYEKNKPNKYPLYTSSVHTIDDWRTRFGRKDEKSVIDPSAVDDGYKHWWEEDQAIEEQEKQLIANQLGISAKQQKKFEHCTNMNYCEKCKEESLCKQYNESILDIQMSNRGDYY